MCLGPIRVSFKIVQGKCSFVMVQLAISAPQASLQPSTSIVDDLLARQDQILDDLDALNAQIEAKIGELAQARRD